MSGMNLNLRGRLFSKSNLDKGTNGFPMIFQMTKNVDGIWQVSFMPIQ
ncbi:hypothetical protein ABE042_04365 [Viridibacillus arvi]